MSQAPPIGKACACVVDARGRLLVFQHPAGGGMQVPKGTIEPGESPEDAVRRELLEESGICYTGALQSLGLLHRNDEATLAGKKHRHPQLWHIFLMHVSDTLPETFDHVATGSPEEDGSVFSYRWLAPTDPIDGFALHYRQAIERARSA